MDLIFITCPGLQFVALMPSSASTDVHSSSFKLLSCEQFHIDHSSVATSLKKRV